MLAALAGFAAFFNIANLVPVWKFDGGQVLRQIFPGQLTLAVCRSLTLSAFLALGRLAGLPIDLLAIAGSSLRYSSLITAGSGVKPRHELKPLVALRARGTWRAFAAVFAVHSYGCSGPCDSCCSLGPQSPTATPSRRGSVPPVEPAGVIAMPLSPEFSSVTLTS